jgi:hypothetical protein
VSRFAYPRMRPVPCWLIVTIHVVLVGLNATKAAIENLISSS